jgi:hypothetical protein
MLSVKASPGFFSPRLAHFLFLAAYRLTHQNWSSFSVPKAASPTLSISPSMLNTTRRPLSTSSLRLADHINHPIGTIFQIVNPSSTPQTFR